MDDVISRQYAIDDIWTVSPLACLDRKWVDRWLRQLPPAQPEIVRCKDCNHFYKDNLNQWCFRGKYGVKEDDFCSYAERRTE